MWKKLNRSKEPSIGHPTMIETTVDDGYLESIPEVDKARSPTSPGSVVSPTLPNLPFKPVDALAPPKPPAKPYPDRASSIYSQPSPGLQNKFPRDSVRQSAVRDSVRAPSSVWSDVSPPDSPRPSYEPYQERSHEAYEVSPIEERSPPREPRLPASRLRSNLPIMKSPTNDASQKGRPGQQGTPASTTRWDDYSGEPTTSEKGRPSSVKPGQELSFGGSGSGSGAGEDEKSQGRKTIFSGLRERDPAKRRQAMQRIRDDAMDVPPEREPWKGASGRGAIPPPVRNDPTAKLKPLQIPQNQNQNQQTVNPDTHKVGASGASELARQTVRPVVPSRQLEEIKPTVPLKTGSNTPRNMSPTSAAYPPSRFNSRVDRKQSPSPSSAPPVMPPTEASVSLPTPPGSTSKPPNPPLTTKQQQQHDAALRSNLASLNLDDQPSSRFSSTTYATTVNESPNSSPRISVDTDAPPVPEMPSPIVMRKRPLPAATKANTLGPISNVKATTRKPAPSDRGARRSSMDSTTTMMTTGTAKDLPAVPPAMNRLDTLNNELATLSHRRVKINNVLKDLAAVTNPTSIAYDYSTRLQTKATVTKLEEELSEIAREEHEIGLKVMRVRRKLDEQDGNWAGEGVLWVKRVTS
ncbi:MAG: hypothetical protein Q9160_009179 [Pyrenula sp. 1 TL-2023]